MAEFATDKLLVTARIMDLVERLRKIDKFKLKGEYPDGNGGVTFKFSHHMTFLSWGEKITVRLIPYNDYQTIVDIVSECAMPTQIIDYGMNNKNLREILTVLLDGFLNQRL